MRTATIVLTVIAALAIGRGAAAWTAGELRAAGIPEDQIRSVPDPTVFADRNMLDDIATFRENGALSWGALANLKMTYVPLGPGITDVRTSVREEVQALDGKRVRLEGYMFPLQGARDHDYFLFSGVPPGCPFHVPGGPAELVEVLAEEPIRYTSKPVMLSGNLEILADEPGGMMYRLTSARALRR